jgi:ribonucleoside-diphosphate reductase beta chain
LQINVNYKGRNLFLDGDVEIARYDVPEFPMLDTLVKRQRGFFWQPEEIQDIIRDKNDFASLNEHEKHIFVSNLLRQTLLDSIQGRAPSEVFTPITSVPEAEIWTQTWAFSETIHSYSYTYIVRNIFANPSEIFESMPTIKEVVDCGEDISQYYDDLSQYNKMVDLYGYNYEYAVGEYDDIEVLTLREHKEKLWKCLMSVNILEGIRFYVSFACSWSFAERKLMEGNAKIIKLIARDENLHLASTQYMLRELRRKDPEFEQIAKDTEAECVQMFMDAVKQEKEWADYLFKDGSMIGLNANILKQYVDYIARQRMKAVELPCDIDVKVNPLPWTMKWIGGKEVQNAPQETNITSYTVGQVKSDLDKNSLKGLKL